MTQWTRLAGSLTIDSSLTPRMHVRSMDEKHAALWRHLCDEAYRLQSTAHSERQGADAALSVLLKGMSEYSVSSFPELGLPQGNGAHDCRQRGGYSKMSRMSCCLKFTMTLCSRGISQKIVPLLREIVQPRGMLTATLS